MTLWSPDDTAIAVQYAKGLAKGVLLAGAGLAGLGLFVLIVDTMVHSHAPWNWLILAGLASGIFVLVVKITSQFDQAQRRIQAAKAQGREPAPTDQDIVTRHGPLLANFGLRKL